jgi:hypothetical protein
MKEQQTRLDNLRALVERAGGAAAFARTYPGVDPTYISQLLNKHRNFGERAARTMETKIGLDRGALDSTPGHTVSSGESDWPFPRLEKLQYTQLKQTQRDAIEEWVIDQVARFQNQLTASAPPTSISHRKKRSA